MFSFREFIKQGFIRAVGHQPDYWVMLNAAGYADRGVLTMEDLAEIQEAIDRQYEYAIPEDGMEDMIEGEANADG